MRDTPTPRRYSLRSRISSPASFLPSRQQSTLSWEVTEVALAARSNRISRIFCIISLDGKNCCFYSKPFERRDNQVIYHFPPHQGIVENIPLSATIIPRLLIYAEQESGEFLGEAVAVLSSTNPEGILPVLLEKEETGSIIYRLRTFEVVS